ncbi:DUF481 domain-containing protein [Octadecabacter sp. CECT 8868]|uniref:DUF481 domain-containing protein n=1 Tax=Octadecabacter algicola TaxID=2909342 RepID=UPI001F480599|nr:DUF481 domain-containing protein [Octadecabacter algicola]MCF2904377.1 DUF481 domain-containing protein [Octadecabacter algicola]
MKNTTLFFAGTALSILATGATAQTFGDSAVDTRNEQLAENIADDFDRDVSTFGNTGRALGFEGSMSLQGSATSGNTDSSSIGIGADFGYYDGTNGYTAQLSYLFSENEGTTDEDSLLYDLEYTRDLGTSYYGFATLQGSVESIPFDTSDNFLGFGVGYRIYDTDQTYWAVQGGVGYRVADLTSADDLDEGAITIGSAYSNQLNETLALTMDTDIISSDSDTVVYNDLGLNVAMTEVLALRTSLVTEYHTEPDAGLASTDNTYGVSLVYNF